MNIHRRFLCCTISMSLTIFCRRFDGLECLDVGGCYNVPSKVMIDLVAKVKSLSEVFAAGLGWDDKSLER